MIKYERVENVATRLREAMYNAEKTQADLARDTGISKATLSRYLSGQFEPKQNAVSKMAIALNVSEMWLWGCDVPMARPAETKKEQPTEYDGLPERKKAFIDKVMQMSDAELDRLEQILSLVENTK